MGSNVWIARLFPGQMGETGSIKESCCRMEMRSSRVLRAKPRLDITLPRRVGAHIGAWTGHQLHGTLVPGNLRRWGITDGWLTATRAIIILHLSFSFPSRRLVERTIPRSINRHRRFARFLVVGLRCMPSPKVCRTGKGDDGLPQLGASFLSESLASGRYHGACPTRIAESLLLY